MAQPLTFTPPLRNPREELLNQLESAPKEHVEALLDLYAILQLLREKGLLEMAKGVLGSGEAVLSILTETVEMDEVVRAVRNLVILVKVLGSIEPEFLEKIVQDLSHAVERGKADKPPGLLTLLNCFSKPAARSALVPVIASIRSAGEHIGSAKASDGKRQKTTRHSA